MQEYTENTILQTYDRYYLFRANKGFSDTDVARLAEIDRGSLVRWKKGRTLPNVKTLFKIATLLNVNVSDILAG